MRSLFSTPLIVVTLAGLGCAPPAVSAGSMSVHGAADSPASIEVQVRMTRAPDEPEQDLVEASNEDEHHDGDAAAAPQPALDQALAGEPPPPPPPPPPKLSIDRKEKAGAASVQAATADSAGAKVDSTTIQQVIAKNVASFRPCLRADMALRLEATISPSGDVLEARSVSSFPDDAKARDCVVVAVKRLHFERFGGAMPARVSFELTLKRALDY